MKGGHIKNNFGLLEEWSTIGLEFEKGVGLNPSSIWALICPPLLSLIVSHCSNVSKTTLSALDQKW